VLCTGATKARDLEAEGRGLNGVHFAMDFLASNTKSLLDSGLEDGAYLSAAGKDVIVIGGGDTATDCVATALRQGCKSLTQFDIYPQKPQERAEDNPWPQWPQVHKRDYGQSEAAAMFGDDPRKFAIMTKRFIGDKEGNLIGVQSTGLRVSKKPDGTWKREEMPDTILNWPAQLVLLAIGFSGPEQELLELLGIERDGRSNIATKRGTYATNQEGVFAAGDARRGQSLIVWAIHEGREAAKACDRYLMGGQVHSRSLQMEGKQCQII